MGLFFAASLDTSATNEKRPRRIIYGAGARARRSASVRLALGNKSEEKSVLAIDRDRRRRFHRFDHIAVFARSRNPPKVGAYDCAARPRRRRPRPLLGELNALDHDNERQPPLAPQIPSPIYGPRLAPPPTLP